jgi:hypothetical protein
MDHSAATATILEFDNPIYSGKQRVIPAHTDIQTGLDWSAALANEDRPACHKLAVKTLHTETLRLAVPSIS